MTSAGRRRRQIVHVLAGLLYCRRRRRRRIRIGGVRGGGGGELMIGSAGCLCRLIVRKEQINLAGLKSALSWVVVGKLVLKWGGGGVGRHRSWKSPKHPSSSGLTRSNRVDNGVYERCCDSGWWWSSAPLNVVDEHASVSGWRRGSGSSVSSSPPANNVLELVVRGVRGGV